MAFQPYYFNLLILTLGALPLLYRGTPPGPHRRLAVGVAGSFFLLSAGLFVLYWSVLWCWILASAAAALLGALAYPRRALVAALVVALPAVGAGLLFQFIPGAIAIVVYLGLGFPFLYAVALAYVLAGWARYDAAAKSLLPMVAVLGFAALIPLSSFLFTFLKVFELVHTPIAIAALTALVAYARTARVRVDAGRAGALASESVGAYVARPMPPWTGLVRVLLLGSGALGLVAALLDASSWTDNWLLAPAALLAVGVTATVARPAGSRPLRAGQAWLVGALTILFGAFWLAERGAAALYIHETGGAASVAQVLTATLAGLGSTLALALAAAWLRDASERSRLATIREPAYPRNAVVKPSRDASVDGLVSLQRSLVERRRRTGVLEVDAPRDPLWTLPDATYNWLVGQADPDHRVHVAIRDGVEIHLIPPILPEESDA